MRRLKPRGELSKNDKKKLRLAGVLIALFVLQKETSKRLPYGTKLHLIVKMVLLILMFVICILIAILNDE